MWKTNFQACIHLLTYNQLSPQPWAAHWSCHGARASQLCRSDLRANNGKSAEVGWWGKLLTFKEKLCQFERTQVSLEIPDWFRTLSPFQTVHTVFHTFGKNYVLVAHGHFVAPWLSTLKLERHLESADFNWAQQSTLLWYANLQA